MIEIIENALFELSVRHTEEELGDRTAYIGASDLGGCPRKIVLEKLNPKHHSLAELLRFKRGHLVEEIVAEALSHDGRFRFTRQVELEDGGNYVPLKAHLDFLFEGPKTVGVLEVKAPRKMPEHPYESWNIQLYLQMGMLKKAFREKGDERKIKGALLLVDLFEGEIKLFNGYTPDDTIYQGCLERAKVIWDCLQNGDPPPVEVSPLCGYCHYIGDCPAFDAEEYPELEEQAVKIAELQKNKKDLEALYKEEANKFVSLITQKGPFKSAGYHFKNKARAKTVTDFDGLSKLLSEFGRSLDEFQTTKTTKPYLVITHLS